MMFLNDGNVADLFGNVINKHGPSSLRSDTTLGNFPQLDERDWKFKKSDASFYRRKDLLDSTIDNVFGRSSKILKINRVSDESCQTPCGKLKFITFQDDLLDKYLVTRCRSLDFFHFQGTKDCSYKNEKDNNGGKNEKSSALKNSPRVKKDQTTTPSLAFLDSHSSIDKNDSGMKNSRGDSIASSPVPHRDDLSNTGEANGARNRLFFSTGSNATLNSPRREKRDDEKNLKSDANPEDKNSECDRIFQNNPLNRSVYCVLDKHVPVLSEEVSSSIPTIWDFWCKKLKKECSKNATFFPSDSTNYLNVFDLRLNIFNRQQKLAFEFTNKNEVW